MAHDNVVLEAFTELAPRYEQTVDQELRMFWGPGYTEFVDRLIQAASIEDTDLILDIATGTVFLPLKIADRLDLKGLIVAVDITPAMLRCIAPDPPDPLRAESQKRASSGGYRGFLQRLHGRCE